MGEKRFHYHIADQCRVHRPQFELHDGGEVSFDTLDAVAVELDRIEAMGPKVAEQFGLDLETTEFRGPHVLMIQTVEDTDDHTKSMGDDGRCHRILFPIHCFGDPEKCAKMIRTTSQLQMMQEQLHRSRTGEQLLIDPDTGEPLPVPTAAQIMALILGGLAMGFGSDDDDPELHTGVDLDELMADISGEHNGPHVHEDGTIMADRGQPAPLGFDLTRFGNAPANEPIRYHDDDDPLSGFDFGGFDEPTDKKPN